MSQYLNGSAGSTGGNLDMNLDRAYVMLYGNLHWVLLPHLTHFFVCVCFYLMAAFIVTLSTRQLLVSLTDWVNLPHTYTIR